MKALRNIGILLLYFSILSSCVQKNEDIFASELLSSVPETKVLKMSEVYDDRTLLVKFGGLPTLSD